jgi:hypothetical protein
VRLWEDDGGHARWRREQRQHLAVGRGREQRRESRVFHGEVHASNRDRHGRSRSASISGAQETLRRGDDEIVSLVATTADIYRPRLVSRESDRGRLFIFISLFDSVEVLHPEASNHLVHRRNIFYVGEVFLIASTFQKTRCSIPELTHHMYYTPPRTTLVLSVELVMRISFSLISKRQKTSTDKIIYI